MCVVQKGYQDTDSVISTVTTKVKGFAFTNTSDMEPRMWDVADYVLPPQVFQSLSSLIHKQLMNSDQKFGAEVCEQ